MHESGTSGGQLCENMLTSIPLTRQLQDMGACILCSDYKATHLNELGHLPLIRLSDFLDSDRLYTLSQSLIDLSGKNRAGLIDSI